MKKIYLFLCLALLLVSPALATGVQDLLGTYQSETPGIPATFELQAQGTGFVLTHCRTLGQETCFTSAVHASVVNNQLMRPGPGSTGHQPMEEMEVRVEERDGKIWMTVSTTDGLSLLFSRPQ